MALIKSLLRKFVTLTKPFVRRLAAAYDVRLDHPHMAHGRFPLTLEGGPEEARHHIPKSVLFSTQSGSIFVGRNTVFGEDVHLLTGKHFNKGEAAAANVDLHHVPVGRDIHIGRNCYIGGRAILIGPLTIGDYAVIGAGAIVTRDVPENAFVAGPRAQIIRENVGLHPDGRSQQGAAGL